MPVTEAGRRLTTLQALTPARRRRLCDAHTRSGQSDNKHIRREHYHRLQHMCLNLVAHSHNKSHTYLPMPPQIHHRPNTPGFHCREQQRQRCCGAAPHHLLSQQRNRALGLV